MTERQIELLETRLTGRRLGRHVQHDERSKNFPVKVAGPEGVYSSVMHRRHVPPFDQGDLGSCTANAGLGAMATDPFFARLPTGHVPLTEAEAVKIYSTETRWDGFPGVYPPDDTGSSGLACAKTLKALGLISGYTHAFTLDAAIKAVMKAPVITGVNWYSSFDRPDADGQVRIKSGATIRGGHEVEVFGVDATKGRVWCYQSWGPKWGPLGNGRFYMTFHTWGVLLGQQGDVTAFVPL